MLSKKTKYGLKALTYIARQENNNPVQIATISAEENIRGFINKIRDENDKINLISVISGG